MKTVFNSENIYAYPKPSSTTRRCLAAGVYILEDMGKYGERNVKYGKHMECFKNNVKTK